MIDGPTTVAIFSLGVQPTGMKNAVIRPHAMIAAMLGMIMFDRNVPNRWTWTRALTRSGAGDVEAGVVVIAPSLSRTGRVRSVTQIFDYVYMPVISAPSRVQTNMFGCEST